MKSIKYKILFSFCILAIVTFAALGTVVSWKLRESISRQSAKLSSDMTSRTHETLEGHIQMLIHNMREDIRRIADNLRKSPGIIHNLEANQINQLTAVLELTSETENIDFAMLFTLEGRLQTSFPYGLNDLGVEEYFNSWTPARRVQDFLHDDSSEEDMIWGIFTQLDPNVLRVFGLDNREFLRNGAFAVVSTGIIKDDFGDPFGICLVGRILNNYDKPLSNLYQTVGLTSVFYSGTTPIAQAGFELKENSESMLSALQLSPEIQEEIYTADQSKNLVLTLAETPYVTTCSTLTSFEKEKIGNICIGLPETEVHSAQQTILASGADTKKIVQKWIWGIGIVSLSLFVCVSLVIATRIVTPLKRLSDIAKRIARGDFQQEIKEIPNDEVGELSKSLKDVMKSFQDITTTSEAIANGELEHLITPRSDRDLLGRALQRMSTYLAEMASVATAIAEGNLAVNISLHSETDAFRLAMHMMTESLHTLIYQIRTSAQQISSTGVMIISLSEQDTHLAQRVETAVEQMTSILTETETSVGQVAQMMESLSSSVEETSSAVSEITATITNIAANATELAQQTQSMISVINISVQSIEQVTGKTDISSQLSQETMQDALEGQQAVEQVRKSMDLIQQTNQNAVERMSSFADQSREIGTILDVIGDITEQSSLLALNASIISAQAGSHGRGFSVIAEEMKNLANGVSASTKNISAIVQSVQQGTDTVVQMIHEGTTKIEEGVQRTQQAEQRLQKIISSAEHSSSVAAEIADALHTQMSTSQGIMRSIEYVSAMTDEIMKSTHEQKAGMIQIHTAIEQIRDIAVQTQEATDKQLDGVREVNDFASTVNTLTKQNLESSERINHATTKDLAPLAQNLVQSVDRFTLKTLEP